MLVLYDKAFSTGSILLPLVEQLSKLACSFGRDTRNGTINAILQI
jgi:hypothetical protein